MKLFKKHLNFQKHHFLDEPDKHKGRRKRRFPSGLNKERYISREKPDVGWAPLS